jgi:hypothetical protein
MTHRTVIILNNDKALKWVFDPELGKKILHAAAKGSDPHGETFEYGSVPECVNGNIQTLMVLEGCAADKFARTNWHDGQEKRDIELLKMMAKALGFSVLKKTKKIKK